jgi:catechol 2,3-dioxygenase-like lactoylglutathione lyase family enzyme
MPAGTSTSGAVGGVRPAGDDAADAEIVTEAVAVCRGTSARLDPRDLIFDVVGDSPSSDPIRIRSASRSGSRAVGRPVVQTGREVTTFDDQDGTMNFKLELVFVPVSDVDRAKAFYVDQVGFVVDHDHQVNDELRFVQLTPPGSACSIAIGTGLVETEPGSVKGLQVVVDDADAARAYLLERGVEAGEVQDLPWGRFTGFRDPDGNEWAVQQIPDYG